MIPQSYHVLHPNTWQESCPNNNFISSSCAENMISDSVMSAGKWEKLPVLLKSRSFPTRLGMIFFGWSYLNCILLSYSQWCAWQTSLLASTGTIDCIWISESAFLGLRKFVKADSVWLPWWLAEDVYASCDGKKPWPLFLSSEILQICPQKANLGIK